MTTIRIQNALGLFYVGFISAAGIVAVSISFAILYETIVRSVTKGECAIVWEEDLDVNFYPQPGKWCEVKFSYWDIQKNRRMSK